MGSDCYLALGSNIGDRRRNIREAIQMIGLLNKTRVIKISRFINTDPVGGPRNQPKFLNAAIKIHTILTPKVLLSNIKRIEKIIGRKKTMRNGPRKIDVDILLYGDRVVKTKDLTIPHPKMFNREFVIKPLSEVIC